MKKLIIGIMFVLLTAGVLFAEGGQNQGTTGSGTTSTGSDSQGSGSQSSSGRQQFYFGEMQVSSIFRAKGDNL